MRELLSNGPDEDLRFDGLLLLVQFLDDIHVLRRVMVKEDDDVPVAVDEDADDGA